MNSDSTDRIKNEKELWNKVASDYDNKCTKFESAYAKTIFKCRNILKGNENVLDIACGTGIITFPLAQYVSHIAGIDISEEMIKIAKSKISKSQRNSIDFKVCDGYNTDFKDESFDIILLFNILHVVNDSSQLLTEVYRLLKKGGYIITATDCYNEELKFSKKIYHLVPKLMKKINKIKYLNCFQKQDIDKLLEKNNFKIEDRDILFDAPLNYYVLASKN